MKKTIFAFSLFFAVQHFCIAQTSIADSLRALLKTAKEDTAQINAMSLLAYELLKSNTYSAIYYANEVKNLSEKLNYSKGITSAYFRLGQAYNNLGDYGKSQAYLSKALELSTDKSTTA